MKTNMLCLAGWVVLSAMISCATAQTASKNAERENYIAFYNIENLFDTINDPLTLDDDFTPSGKLQWNTLRYEEKLDRISEAIELIPGRLPVFIGLCEIENESVLKDLVREPALHESSMKGDYKIIHSNSPDERGIDVAALYDATVLKNVSFEYFTIALPDPNDPNTRDLLYAKGKMDSDVIHFFVNHWPSRSGGQAESEPNRLAVAGLLRSKVDSVLATDANARIVIMGDFNDHPNDRSIQQVLGAKESPDSMLFDHMYALHMGGNGSYFYKGEWGALDQMITSKAIMNASGWHVTATSAGIERDEKLLYRDKEGVARPSRSYAGDSYKGGYSDHLPVYLRLER